MSIEEGRGTAPGAGLPYRPNITILGASGYDKQMKPTGHAEDRGTYCGAGGVKLPMLLDGFFGAGAAMGTGSLRGRGQG